MITLKLYNGYMIDQVNNYLNMADDSSSDIISTSS